MSWKESRLYSIVKMKCPRCHQGDLFPKGTLYTTKFSQMHTHCDCCGQVYEPEPGYYYGAMFVSYAFSTAIFIGVWIAMGFLMEEITMTAMIMALLVVVVGLLPINYRLSRAIWINLFMGYQGMPEGKNTPCE